MVVGAALFFATLKIVSPIDGEAISLMREGQRAYFAAPCQERLEKWANQSFRDLLVKVGSGQMPVRVEWQGGKAGEEVGIELESGGKNIISEVYTNRTSVYFTNLEIEREYRVRVNSGGETNSVVFQTVDEAPRGLYAEGVGNFRDMGGWKTRGGKRVKQNMIFRSAGLRDSATNIGHSLLNPKYKPGEMRISERGIDTLLEEFKIKTEVELRTEQECACMKGSVMGDDITWVHESLAAYDFIDNLARGKEPFARLFATFCDKERYPILVHCSGGSDRTGTLMFLLNGLLGVSEEELCRDWEYSAFFDSGINFSPDRLARLCNYIKSQAGENFGEKVESFVRSCGITSTQIEDFRSIMLE